MTQKSLATLIQKYRKIPTPSNRKSLQSYLDKYPMAWATCPQLQRDFLRANQFNLLEQK